MDSEQKLLLVLLKRSSKEFLQEKLMELKQQQDILMIQREGSTYMHEELSCLGNYQSVELKNFRKRSSNLEILIDENVKKRTILDGDCNRTSFIVGDIIDIQEIKPPLDQAMFGIISKILIFQDKRNKNKLIIWLLNGENTYLVLKDDIAKILSSYKVKTFEIIKLTRDQKQLFIENAGSNLSIEVESATFLKVSSDLIKSISKIIGFTKIGDAVCEFLSANLNKDFEII